MSRREWPLKGVYKRYVLIDRRDVHLGEKALPFMGGLIPCVFDPTDPLSVREAVDLCRTLATDAHFSLRTAGQQRTYLEDHIKGALDRGQLVMISKELDVSDIQVARPKERGAGKAWLVARG